MPSLNLDINYFEHFKIKRLIGLLGDGAELYPIKLWSYCAKIHAETGYLRGYTIKEIEAIMGWKGISGNAVHAFISVGLLKGSMTESLDPTSNKRQNYAIKGWLEYQSHLKAFKQRSRKANKKRWSDYRREKSLSLKESINAPKDSLGDPLTILTNYTIKDITHTPVSKPPTTKEYIIDTPLKKVVCGWKVVTGYKKDDRVWDKANWSRTAKSAKTILDFFGEDWVASVDCCEDIRAEMSKNKLTCTIETVVKHMADWKIKHRQPLAV